MGRLVENLMQTILPIHASSTSNKLSFVKHVPAVGNQGIVSTLFGGLRPRNIPSSL